MAVGRLSTSSMVALHLDGCRAPTSTSLVSSSCPPNSLPSPCGVGKSPRQGREPRYWYVPIATAVPSEVFLFSDLCSIFSRPIPPFQPESPLALLPSNFCCPASSGNDHRCGHKDNPPALWSSCPLVLLESLLLSPWAQGWEICRQRDHGTAHFSERLLARSNQPAPWQRRPTQSEAGQEPSAKHPPVPWTDLMMSRSKCLSGQYSPAGGVGGRALTSGPRLRPHGVYKAEYCQVEHQNVISRESTMPHTYGALGHILAEPTSEGIRIPELQVSKYSLPTHVHVKYWVYSVL